MKLTQRTTVGRTLRSCVLLAAAGGLLLQPLPAGAEAATHEHTRRGSLTFQCGSPPVQFRVFGSQSAGYQALVLAATVGGTRYYAGDHSSYPSPVPAGVTYTRARFVAEIPVRTTPNPSGPTVGLMTIAAHLAHERPQVVKSAGGKGSGDANDQVHSIYLSRRLLPVGAVHVAAPDGAVAVAGNCSGSLAMGSTSGHSDPHATVYLSNHAGGSCDPITVGEDEYFLALSDAPSAMTTSATELPYVSGQPALVLDPDQSTAWGEYYGHPSESAGDNSDLESWSRGVSFYLTNDRDEVGATAYVRFVGDESASFPVYSGTWTAHLKATLGRVEGTLSFPNGVTVPISCDAYSVDDRFIRAGGAPSTAVPPPNNDLPTGALPLRVGNTATAETPGAEPGVEAPFECLTDEEDGHTLVTNTVWYTVTGNGPVTIDTAGTRFDSALAAYTADGAGALTPVPEACNDDTWTPFGPDLLLLNLQASVTFDAHPGVTYFVQVGGTEADRNFGSLSVSAS